MTSARGILASLDLPADTPLDRTAGLVAANERIKSGDDVTREAFTRAGRYLGRFLAPAILLMDPARVTFYGHQYLAKQEYESAIAFHDGLRTALTECAASRPQVLEQSSHRVALSRRTDRGGGCRSSSPLALPEAAYPLGSVLVGLGGRSGYGTGRAAAGLRGCLVVAARELGLSCCDQKIVEGCFCSSGSPTSGHCSRRVDSNNC